MSDENPAAQPGFVREVDPAAEPAQNLEVAKPVTFSEPAGDPIRSAASRAPAITHGGGVAGFLHAHADVIDGAADVIDSLASFLPIPGPVKAAIVGLVDDFRHFADDAHGNAQAIATGASPLIPAGAPQGSVSGLLATVNDAAAVVADATAAVEGAKASGGFLGGLEHFGAEVVGEGETLLGDVARDLGIGRRPAPQVSTGGAMARPATVDKLTGEVDPSAPGHHLVGQGDTPPRDPTKP